MSKKKRKNVVYSTNPDFEYEEEFDEQETLEPADQELRVQVDRKQRKGKTVTLITGFHGSEEDLKELSKKLKSKCGVGGSAKEGEIIIQGALKDKIHDILIDLGYRQTKKVGGN